MINVELITKFKRGLIIAAEEAHKKTVIWLPGIADCANGSLLKFDNRIWNPFDKSTKIVLLNPPRREVKIAGRFFIKGV